MSHDEIVNDVLEQTAQALEVDRGSIKLESSLVKDLQAESIDLIDLTFRLERVFGIRIAEGELFDRQPGPGGGPVDNVGAVVEYIEKQLGMSAE